MVESCGIVSARAMFSFELIEEVATVAAEIDRNLYEKNYRKKSDVFFSTLCYWNADNTAYDIFIIIGLRFIWSIFMIYFFRRRRGGCIIIPFVLMHFAEYDRLKMSITIRTKSLFEYNSLLITAAWAVRLLLIWPTGRADVASTSHSAAPPSNEFREKKRGEKKTRPIVSWSLFFLRQRLNNN